MTSIPHWVSCLHSNSQQCVSQILYQLKPNNISGLFFLTWEMIVAYQCCKERHTAVVSEDWTTAVTLTLSFRATMTKNWKKRDFQRIPVETSCSKSLSDGVSLWPHGHELPVVVVWREPAPHTHRPHHHHTHTPTHPYTCPITLLSSHLCMLFPVVSYVAADTRADAV